MHHNLGNRVKVMRVWYADAMENVKSKIQNGFGDIDNSEEGLFGKGIYFSSSPKYVSFHFTTL